MPRIETGGTHSTKLRGRGILLVSNYLFQQDVIYPQELAKMEMVAQHCGGQYSDMEKIMTSFHCFDLTML
jgi:hypothetical protein